MYINGESGDSRDSGSCRNTCTVVMAVVVVVEVHVVMVVNDCSRSTCSYGMVVLEVHVV